MKLAILLLVTLLAAAQGRSLLANDDEPASPPYKVLNTTSSLEIREYENATWAVAIGKSRWSVDFAAHSAGLALLRYFKGGNVAHTEISPTVPLVAAILTPPHPPPQHKNGSHHGPQHDGNGTDDNHHGKHHDKHHHEPHGPPAVALAAYIPAKYEGKAPIPDCPQVKIVKTNSSEVYVHKFGGWAVSFVVKHEIHHLALALKDLKICPKKGKFFVATYDGPFKIFGRHNEIMWSKALTHGHHNDSLHKEESTFEFSNSLKGFEAFDIEALFPEEFPAPKDLKVEDYISEHVEDLAELADETVGKSGASRAESIGVETY